VIPVVELSQVPTMTTMTGMMHEVNNNLFDCSTLGFVKSHGKSKIKGKWPLCMDFGDGARMLVVQKVKHLLKLLPVDFDIVVIRGMTIALFFGSNDVPSAY